MDNNQANDRKVIVIMIPKYVLALLEQNMYKACQLDMFLDGSCQTTEKQASLSFYTNI